MGTSQVVAPFEAQKALIFHNLLRSFLEARFVFFGNTWKRVFRTSACSLAKRNSLKIKRRFEMGGYILRKPYIRRKMIILNSLILPKNVSGVTL